MFQLLPALTNMDGVKDILKFIVRLSLSEFLDDANLLDTASQYADSLQVPSHMADELFAASKG